MLQKCSFCRSFSVIRLVRVSWICPSTRLWVHFFVCMWPLCMHVLWDQIAVACWILHWACHKTLLRNILNFCSLNGTPSKKAVRGIIVFSVCNAIPVQPLCGIFWSACRRHIRNIRSSDKRYFATFCFLICDSYFHYSECNCNIGVNSLPCKVRVVQARSHSSSFR